MKSYDSLVFSLLALDCKQKGRGYDSNYPESAQLALNVNRVFQWVNSIHISNYLSHHSLSYRPSITTINQFLFNSIGLYL